MTGSYVADDFYFFFEKSDIEKLLEQNYIEGDFVTIGNTHDAGLLKMKLVVSVKKKNKKFTDSEILISLQNTCLNITKEDFKEWFISPSDWVRENGPNWRFCSSNVYIQTDMSKNSSNFRNLIERFIKMAK